MDEESVRRKAAACTQNNTNIQTSMPVVGFEPMTTVFERVMVIHALDRAAVTNGES
jgi:hypothetical protein